MLNTYTRPVRALRNNYNEILDLANEGNQVIITQNGQESAIVIGIKAFREYENYIHRQFIHNELTRTQAKLEMDNTIWLEEDEFWNGFMETI